MSSSFPAMNPPGLSLYKSCFHLFAYKTANNTFRQTINKKIALTYEMLTLKTMYRSVSALAVISVFYIQTFAQKNTSETVQQNAVNPVDLIGLISGMFN